jgi:UrcA family protein
MSKFYVLPVLLTAVFAGPAMADPGTERVTIVVETRDLDLADTHGQRRLQHRVRAASTMHAGTIAAICGPHVARRNVGSSPVQEPKPRSASQSHRRG